MRYVMRYVMHAVLLALLAPGPAPLAAQDGDKAQSPAVRAAAHGRALARMGRSGLRGLLSASGSLGDLQNRAGSYRMAANLERARTAALEGRLRGLEAALQEPDLPAVERERLRDLRAAARAELATVPVYEADYRTVTAQAEGLLPFGFLEDRPLFLRVRGRGHRRGGGSDGLTVLSGAVSAGPVLALDRWIFSPGLVVGRTEVDIVPFEGESETTSVGPTLNVGHVPGDRLSVALELGHVWSRGGSTIVRPDRPGGTTVRTEASSRTTSAKVEVLGRVPLGGPDENPVVLRPRAGVFARSTYSSTTTNSLGEPTTGRFGPRETLAALRVGAVIGTRLGGWRPSLYLGWEHELTDEMNVLVRDPDAILGSAGLAWSWARGRRLSVEYGLLRGTGGLRRVSELTVVAILDG